MKETERLVVRDIADAMVATITAERLADVTRVSLASALSTVDLNQRRAALGASSKLDVLRAEQLAQDARANVVTADETLRRAREALGTAFGSFEAYGVNPDIGLDTLAEDARSLLCTKRRISTGDPTSSPRTRTWRSPNDARTALPGAFWPTVDAVSTLGVHGARSPAEQRVRRAGPSARKLNWLLYDGGDPLRAARGIRGNGARRARAAHRHAPARQHRDRPVDARGQSGHGRTLGVFTRSREIAAETARLAKVAFMNGSGTSFDLVDTAGRQRQAEIDLTVKEFELLRARVAAFLALASCNV